MCLEYLDEDYEFEVQTYIETCVYQNDKMFDMVISKTILFDDGYEETILLKYVKGLKDLDEIDDVCNEVISADKDE